MQSDVSCLLCPMGKLFSKSKSRNDTYGTRYEDHAGYPAQEPVVDFRQYPACHQDAVMSVAAVQPGVCVSGSKDNTLVVFDYKFGQVRQRWTGHEKEVTKVLYGPQVQSYFSASRDKRVCMWQAGQSEPVLTFSGHELVVTGITLNNENSTLCTGSRDNWMKLWDVQTGTCINQNFLSRNLITHVKWGENSHLIAQTGEDKEARIWDSNNLQVVKAFPRKQHIQTCCDISVDNNYCLTSSNGFQGNGCEATLWDIRGGNIVHEFKGHTETVAACCFLPPELGAGRPLIATSGNDCTVRIWDRDSAVCVSSVSLAGAGPLTSLAAYDDGSICVASFNTGVHVLQLDATPSGEISLVQKAQY